MIRAGRLPALCLFAASRWWKRDALFELPLAHHAVASVDDDHAHRRTQAYAEAAGIVLEHPASFLRADEPAYNLAPAVIVIHSHRKLLSLTHSLRPTQKKGGTALPLTAAGRRLIARSGDDRILSDQPRLKLIQCLDVRHSRPVMEVLVALGGPLALGARRCWPHLPDARWSGSFALVLLVHRHRSDDALRSRANLGGRLRDAWKAWAKLEEID
jgi:hypothetical protein